MKAGSEIPTSTPERPNPAGRTADSRTTDQVTGAAHDSLDRVADKAARAEGRIRDMAATGGEQLKEKGTETVDQVRQYTKDNPLAAAGIAFAAGLVLSRLLGR